MNEYVLLMENIMCESTMVLIKNANNKQNKHTHTQLTGRSVKLSTGLIVGLIEVGSGEGRELIDGIILTVGLALGNPSVIIVSTVTLCPTRV